jgi:hypothetical protein
LDIKKVNGFHNANGINIAKAILVEVEQFIEVFFALFRTLWNREYFDSHNETGGFGKRGTRRIKYTVGLRRETQYKTHHGAVKMSFFRVGDFLPCSGLCQINSGYFDLRFPHNWAA